MGHANTLTRGIIGELVIEVARRRISRHNQRPAAGFVGWLPDQRAIRVRSQRQRDERRSLGNDWVSGVMAAHAARSIEDRLNRREGLSAVTRSSVGICSLHGGIAARHDEKANGQ
jgi:hypothetical protein